MKTITLLILFFSSQQLLASNWQLEDSLAYKITDGRSGDRAESLLTSDVLIQLSESQKASLFSSVGLVYFNEYDYKKAIRLYAKSCDISRGHCDAVNFILSLYNDRQYYASRQFAMESLQGKSYSETKERNSWQQEYNYLIGINELALKNIKGACENFLLSYSASLVLTSLDKRYEESAKDKLQRYCK